ncbi:hypothetical protein SBA3_1900026 [Candidatus Sulfopaludibacter sp. SbA3]|nr:hypothetical protein SBA3_1900026 [Candidatus Sulfopaludibacter sp. SbA3]
MLRLKQLQAERKAALQQVVEEATLLAQFAASKGEPYDVERDFPPEAHPHNLLFRSPKSLICPAIIAASTPPKSSAKPLGGW